MTIGIVVVASLAAQAAGVPIVTMTWTLHADEINHQRRQLLGRTV
jgi:hypothetical protein